MAKKQKTQIQKATDALSQTAAQAGLVMMAAAATLGVAELPNDHDKRAILPMQPAFATVHEIDNHASAGNNELRRERDEVHPHYISYSVNQRTPGRTGRV